MSARPTTSAAVVRHLNKAAREGERLSTCVPVFGGVVHIGPGRPDPTYTPKLPMTGAAYESASAIVGSNTMHTVRDDTLWQRLRSMKAEPADMARAAEWLEWMEQFVPTMAKLDRALGVINYAYGASLTKWPKPIRRQPSRKAGPGRKPK